MGSAIANVIDKHVDGVEASAKITGGSFENVTLLGNSEVEMGMANGNLVYAGVNGHEPYEQAYPEIRCMFAVQPSVFQLVTMENIGVNTLEDLRGKRGRGRPGRRRPAGPVLGNPLPLRYEPE